MADEYERRQMSGIGEVLFRHKVTSPRWLVALLAGLPLVLGTVPAVALLASGLWIAGLAVLGTSIALFAFFTFLMVTFASARIAVSEGEVHIQLGLAGPRIPIAEIEGVELAPSGINKVGMGVGKDLRGTTYYRLWGDNRRAIHLRRKDRSHLVVVMREPEAMLAAIREALARRDRAKVRVEITDEAGGVATETEAQADAELADRRIAR